MNKRIATESDVAQMFPDNIALTEAAYKDADRKAKTFTADELGKLFSQGKYEAKEISQDVGGMFGSTDPSIKRYQFFIDGKEYRADIPSNNDFPTMIKNRFGTSEDFAEKRKQLFTEHNPFAAKLEERSEEHTSELQSH